MRALRFLFSAGCLLGAFMLGALGLRHLPLDRGERTVIEQKVKHLAAHAAEYDTLFLGSSRVYRQINPAIFDRTTAALGRPTRSFNFGVDGMFPPEDDYACEQMLAVGPQKLRRVFLEANSFLTSRVAAAEQPRNVINWHDWPRTLSAIRSFQPELKKIKRPTWAKRWAAWRRYAEDWGKVWPEAQGHLRAYAVRATNLGEGSFALRRLMMPPKTEREPAPVIIGTHGFVPITDPPKPGALELFERERNAVRVQGIMRRPMAPESQANLERMMARIRATGAEVILVTSPTSSNPIQIAKAETPGVRLDFADEQKFPAFYETRYRQDVGHLNAAGAEIYSKVVAETWLQAAPKTP